MLSIPLIAGALVLAPSARALTGTAAFGARISCIAPLLKNRSMEFGQWAERFGTHTRLGPGEIIEILPSDFTWLNRIAASMESCCKLKLKVSTTASSAFDGESFYMSPKLLGAIDDEKFFRIRLGEEMGVEIAQNFQLASAGVLRDPNSRLFELIEARMHIGETGYRRVGDEILFTGEGASELSEFARAVKTSGGYEVRFRAGPGGQAPEIVVDESAKVIYLDSELAFGQEISSSLALNRTLEEAKIDKIMAAEGAASPFAGVVYFQPVGSVRPVQSDLFAQPFVDFSDLKKAVEKPTVSNLQAIDRLAVGVSQGLEANLALYREAIAKLEVGNARINVRDGKAYVTISVPNGPRGRYSRTDFVKFEIPESAIVADARSLSGVVGLVNRTLHKKESIAAFKRVSEPILRHLRQRLAQTEKIHRSWSEVRIANYDAFRFHATEVLVKALRKIADEFEPSRL